jgi:dTDP-4-dehydrorhamnose reductase
MICEVDPGIIIHAAAMTDVDECEADPDRAWQANQQATKNLVSTGIPLIFLSTDQVYPDGPGPHPEDSAAPVNVYGKTKWAAERAVLVHPQGLVVRTNFFGRSRTPGRQSLSDFFASAFREGRPVTLFTDVLFSPLHVDTLCDVIIDLARRHTSGVINVGSRDGLSKRDFALVLAAHMGLRPTSGKDGRSTDVAGRARRPRDLRMDVTALERTLGRQMPSLAEEIRKL